MTAASTNRALELLRGLPADARGIRERALRALRTVGAGDGVGIASFGPAAGLSHLARWAMAEGAGAEIFARFTDPELARHGFQHTDLRLARPIERRSFRNMGQVVDRGVLLESTNWTQIYVPARVHDQVRLVATRQDEVVAHLSVFRGVGTPLFDAPAARLLQPLVEPLRRAMSAADALERDGAPQGPADVVLDPRGRVRFASLEARAWLERSGFREHLASLVRRADGERPPSSTHAGGLIDLVRVHGEGGRVRYLAHVTPARPLRLAPVSALTDAQREIAQLVAAGATVPEVADMTQRSRETVRSHLKAIYERLGVASRAELARALEPQA